MLDTTVTRVEAWTIEFPLATPLSFGSIKVDRRSYVIVRVTTRGGIEGVAYSLSRSAPIDLVVTEVLGPLIVGQDALQLPAIMQTCADATVPLGHAGLVQRAMSLVDICLWDIKARQFEAPLWRVLGGFTSEVPLLLVDGYPQAGESDRDFAARLARRADEGYRAIKITNHMDPPGMADRLRAVRLGTPEDLRLVIDLVWSWRDLQSAIDAARRWAPYHLAWIEDPFPPTWTEATAAMRTAGVPLAAGDEVSDERLFDDFLRHDAIDVVRLDATTIGGISGFARVHAKARSRGRAVSPHIYPEIHQHCAFAWPGTVAVEMFPADSPYDFSHQFSRQAELLRCPTPGVLAPPDAPGLGLDIDWDVVDAHVLRRSSCPR